MRTVGLRAFATAAPKRKGQKAEAAPAVEAAPAMDTLAEEHEEAHDVPEDEREATEPPATEDAPEEQCDQAEPEKPAEAAKPAPKRKGQKAAGDAA